MVQGYGLVLSIDSSMYQMALHNEGEYATNLVRVATTSASIPIGTDVDSPTITRKHKQKPHCLIKDDDNAKPASRPLKVSALKSQGSTRKLGKAIPAVSSARPAIVSSSPVVPKTIDLEPTSSLSVSSNSTSKRKRPDKPLPLSEQFHLPNEALSMDKYPGKSFD